MFQVSVNDKRFEIDLKEGSTTVNNTRVDFDVTQISSYRYHVIYRNKSYRIETPKPGDTKEFSFKVNGRPYSVQLKDKFDLLLEKMGLNSADMAKLNTVKAPMPGLVVEIKVKPGDHVAIGDALVILEAMKMENIIRSAGDGVVKSINVKKGDGVEKNQVLIEF